MSEIERQGNRQSVRHVTDSWPRKIFSSTTDP